MQTSNMHMLHRRAVEQVCSWEVGGEKTRSLLYASWHLGKLSLNPVFQTSRALSYIIYSKRQFLDNKRISISTVIGKPGELFNSALI